MCRVVRDERSDYKGGRDGKEEQHGAGLLPAGRSAGMGADLVSVSGAAGGRSQWRTVFIPDVFHCAVAGPVPVPGSVGVAAQITLVARRYCAGLGGMQSRLRDGHDPRRSLPGHVALLSRATVDADICAFTPG